MCILAVNIALELRLKCAATLAISSASARSRWVGGSEQQFTVSLRHVDSYVLRCSPTANCHLRLAAVSAAALHKLANNVEHSAAAALLRWPCWEGRRVGVWQAGGN